METHVWRGLAGGCGKEGQNKGGARIDKVLSFTENVQHSPQIHERMLPDVLSGGVGQTDASNTPAFIG